MAEFSKLIITGRGQALIAKTIAGTGNIEFAKISTSSAVYNLEQVEGLTELANVEQTSLISSITRTNETAVKIETSFNNLELKSGYYMRSLGLYAVDPDEGEILYAVTTEVSGNCYMPAYNDVTVSGAYVKLITTVGNAEHVSLEVNAAATATVGNIRELKDNLDTVEIRFDETEVTERENIQSQDTLGTMFKKIKKWFSDLKAGAFASIVNNCTTTEEGTVLDGRQGKVLQDQIMELQEADNEINSKITTLNSKLTAVSTFSYGTITNVNGDNWLTLVKYGRLCILTGHVKGDMSNTHKATLQYKPLYHIEAPGASDGGLEGLFALDTSGRLYAKKSGGGDAGGGALRVCISFISQ